MRPTDLPTLLRRVEVGDLVPARALRRQRPRVLEATAVIVPGHGRLARYLAAVEEAMPEMENWDGRVVVFEPDGRATHRLLIVDRYGQVYHCQDAPDEDALLAVPELIEWFRFLATACPECGVIDDPRPRSYVL